MLFIHLSFLVGCVIQFCTPCLTLDWIKLNVEPHLENIVSRKQPSALLTKKHTGDSGITSLSL